MRVLLVTQYYPPEIGAPQNRLHELAVRMQSAGIEVKVLTAMPNYPAMEIHAAYKSRWYVKEEIEGVTVYRSSIFVSKSKGIFKRLLNYFSFVHSSMFTGLFRTGGCDVVICESPPLFLGISAWWLSVFKGARFVFNVSDLWPESAEKLGLVSNKLMLKLAYWLEAFLYKRAKLVSGQTQGIVASINERFPGKKTYWLPNGVDPDIYALDSVAKPRAELGIPEEAVALLYAGIIGHAQGLEVILRAAKELTESDVCFVLLGAGPVKEELLNLRSELELKNVHFLDPVPKTEMPSIVAAMDAAVIPLRKLPLFEGAIPSKIFENMALKKPLVLGVDGEAKTLFIDEGQAGVHFEPENADALAEAVRKLIANRDQMKQLGENGRRLVENRFNRNKIANEFTTKLKDEFGS